MSKSRRSFARSTWTKLTSFWKGRRKPSRKADRAAFLFETLENRALMAGDVYAAFAELYASQNGLVGPVAPTNNSSNNVFSTSQGGEGEAAEGEDAPDLVAFAKALTTAGAKLFGAAWNTDTTAQRQLFEDGNQFLPFTDVTNPDRSFNSLAAANNITTLPTWVFANSTRLTGPQTLNAIATAAGITIPASSSPTFTAIPNQTVLAGAPTWLGLDGYDPNGGTLTYEVTSSNPSLLQVSVPTTNRSLQMVVEGFGTMTFELFDNFAPRVTDRITTLVNSGFYNKTGSNQIIFHRVVSNFVIQAGDPTGTGSGGSTLGDFDDQYNVNLLHTTSGLLSMAKSADDTNDSQFFVTDGATRTLDFNHSIFGRLIEGDAVREAIQNTKTTSDRPDTPIVISSMSVITSDAENGVLQLKAAHGTTGTATVTVKVKDQDNNEFTQTFNVTVAPDNAPERSNSAPFLADIGPVRGVTGQPVTIQLQSTDIEGNAVFYDASKPPGETVAYTVTTNDVTGLVTITPPANFMGTFDVLVGVRGREAADVVDTFDTQRVTVTVGPAAPTSIDLLDASDSGTSSTDNITKNATADFTVNGVTSGATVKLKKGDTVLATVTASGTTATFTNVSLTALGQGTHVLTATQTVGTTESDVSPSLSVTFDTTAPGAFTSTAPTGNPVGFDFNYNAQSVDEGTTGFQYSLTTPPAGATINANTGVVTWTPTTGQIGTQNFTIVASDAAGNTVSQALAVAVDDAQLDLVFKLTNPDGTPLTSLTTGQNFLLKVFTKDLRTTSPQGAFSAYMDVLWDSTKAIATGDPVFGAGYPIVQGGSIATPGFIDELGATGNFAPIGAGEKELASVPMRATAAGNLTFTSEPSERPERETTLYGGEEALIAKDVHFGGVSINVTGVLTAANDTFSVGRNSTANVLNVLANDTIGVGGTALRVVAKGNGSAGGTIVIGPNGANITYTPANNFTGTESFSYTITDRASGTPTSQGIVTVTVSGLIANNDTFTVTEDVPNNTLNPLANDQLDSQFGGTLTITAVNAQANDGTFTITDNGTRVSYSPPSNFQGTKTVTYTIADGGGRNATGTMTVTVTNVNDAPTAVADTLTAFKNSTVTLDPLANDTSTPDPTENLTISSITQPATGTLTITEGGKKLSYAPLANTTGTVSFTYTISDPGGLTSTVTSTINVQDFIPSSLAGFVYFDVNNNGIKDGGELPIVGVTMTLTASGVSGFTTQTAQTADDGSYKFSNLAPGTYTITQTEQPAFTIDGKDTPGNQGAGVTAVASRPTTGANAGLDQIVITNMVQDTTSVGNNFGEFGRVASTITLRDFFGSRAKNHTFTALDTSGAETWHTLDTPPWAGFTNASFALQSNNTQLRMQVTNPQSQQVSSNIPTTSKKVILQGQSTATGQTASTRLYRYLGGPGDSSLGTTNQSPVAVADTYSAAQNSTLSVAVGTGVLANDTDAEGNTLTATVVAQPTRGTLTLNANGSFNYVPTTGLTGQDSFTYRAGDGTSFSNTATVTINVATNTAPTGVADTYTMAEDATLNVAVGTGVLSNDTDPEGNTLTATVTTQPASGALSLATNGSFSYIPTANFNGVVSFVYRATDSAGAQSALTTVSITVTAVNDPPSGQNDAYSVAEDNTIAVPAGTGVLANDTDLEGNNRTAVIDTQPAHGSVTLNSDGSFTYIPQANFFGVDTFMYKAQDGGAGSPLSAPITVSITVTSVNDAPVAVTDSFSVNENATLTVAAKGVLTNDTDDTNQNNLTATIAVTPLHADSFTLNADGSFTYIPDPGFRGTDSFAYRANDGTDNSTTAVVTITVNPINHAPTVLGDTYTVQEDATLSVAPQGVLGNDTDDDQNGLTAIKLQDPANGTLTLNGNGSFTYKPNANFSGTDSFTYVANDGTINSSPATVTITVTALNDAPVAVTDSFSIPEGGTLTVAAAGVLINDTDPDAGDPKTAHLGTNVQNGTLTLNTNGSFTYIPNAEFSGTDSFSYRVNDGTVDSATTVVTLTVNGSNDAPTADNDSHTVAEDATLVVAAGEGVLENDDDADNDALTAELIGNVLHGDLTFNSDGSFTYVPDDDFNGTDSFTYIATDSALDSNTATVTLTITAVNDAPEAEDDTLNVPQGGVLLVPAPGILANDSDTENSSLTVGIVAQPQNGSLTEGPDGGFTYTPSSLFTGTDSFSYQASDGNLQSTVAIVTINVHAANDAPVATDDAYTVTEGTTLSVPLAAGVLANDSDANTDTLTAAVVTGPANGTLTLGLDGRVTYVPNPTFVGQDSFTYSVSDGLATDEATVIITVEDAGGEGEAEGEGESALNDLALLAYLASASGDEELSSLIYAGAEGWQSAADQYFAGLGN